MLAWFSSVVARFGYVVRTESGQNKAMGYYKHTQSYSNSQINRSAMVSGNWSDEETFKLIENVLKKDPNTPLGESSLEYHSRNHH